MISSLKIGFRGHPRKDSLLTDVFNNPVNNGLVSTVSITVDYGKFYAP